MTEFCYVIVEFNHGYNDSTKRERYLTLEEAERAKPPDSHIGWERLTYSIEKETILSLSPWDSKALFKKYKKKV